MREGWGRQAVRDVVEQVKRGESLQSGKEYQLLGVRWYAGGPFARETATTESSKANKVYRVESGDFMYNRLFAWKGSFGVVSPELAGSYVSGEFPVFVTDQSKLLPEYLFHYMARPAVWDQILLESTGSTATSRNRWKEDRFLTMEIDLPPVQEQRRIVDLISSIDHAIEEGTVMTYLPYHLWESLVDSEIGGNTKLDLSMVLERARAGGTPNRKKPEYFGGEIPWLKSGEVDNPQIRWTEESITKEGLAGSSAWVVPAAAVVVAMYGATAGEVGFLVEPMATNQAVLALVGKPEVVDQRFLYHWLRSRSSRMKARATGAAQPNLSKARVLEEPFPDLPVEQQQATAGMLDSVIETATSASAVVESLQKLRGEILSQLLSGVHEISDSYDRFLEEAS